MLWGKKEEKRSLPDLPPLRKVGFDIGQSRSREAILPQEEPDEKMPEKQEFPSFPDSMNEKGFSQAAIKDAVGDDIEERDFSREKKPSEMAPMKYLPPHSDNNYKTVEMEEWTPSVTNQESPARPSSNIGLGEPPAMNFSRAMSEIQKVPKNTDIFVKLDKFYSARKALLDAQQKMEDIDELLKRIRETKMREEQELIAWEKELMGVKARMNDITVNIFEKVD